MNAFFVCILDELDDISARDIAMARYKRNHDYFSEIFTPYNAGNVLEKVGIQGIHALLLMLDRQHRTAPTGHFPKQRGFTAAHCKSSSIHCLTD
jgi:hypothetical protein